MHDRAQSELVGFALIFGLVLLAILLVAAMGTAGLNSAQQHQQTSNVQPAFEVLSGNVDDITIHGAPSRGTEIKLVNAALTVEEAVEITVETDNTIEVYTVHGMVYDSGSGTTVSYAGGMLIREDNDGRIVFGEPNAVFSDQSIGLLVADTRSDGLSNVGGTVTTLIEKRHAGSATVFENDVDVVTIGVDGPHAGVWGAYLAEEATSTDGCEVIDSTTIRCTPERVYVTIDRLDITFS